LLTFRFVNHTQTFVQLNCAAWYVGAFNVKEYLEYQQARQMPALQHFLSDLERRDETCADVMNVLFYVLEREKFVQNVGLRYFTMQCNNAQNKRMDQDLFQGQLYNVHNKIKISTKHWLGLGNGDNGIVRLKSM
jgi:hypothetical protein